MHTARRLAPLLALAALLASLVAGPPAGAAAPPSEWAASTPTAQAVAVKPALRTVLRLVNRARARHDRAPLRLTRCLTRKVAQPWARSMADSGVLEHQDLGRVFRTCPGLTMVGENIASGYPTARAVMRAWMKSPGHRANILKRGYRKLGLGLARSANGTPYWVQDFGR